MAEDPNVFHSEPGDLRISLHTVLVRPELSRNIGSAARALANMGMRGKFCIVGTPNLVDSESRKLAKHARFKLDELLFFPSLENALSHCRGAGRSVVIAATARSGSAHRPHPQGVREAVTRGIKKLSSGDIESLTFVFGPEADGLTNADVDLCDWVATIPSAEEYRSLNLAQAVLLFAHEANMELLPTAESGSFSNRPSQKERLVQHLLQLAEEVGFVLPNDPFKMRPRLEEILSHLPNHIQEIKTLHGFIDQTLRSVRSGKPDIKGRFRAFAKPEPSIEGSG